MGFRRGGGDAQYNKYGTSRIISVLWLLRSIAKDGKCTDEKEYRVITDYSALKVLITNQCLIWFT